MRKGTGGFLYVRDQPQEGRGGAAPDDGNPARAPRRNFAPMASYTLQPVETAAHRRAFLVCPDQHYRTAPLYVRPNDQEVAAIFEPAKNKLFEAGGQAARWLLLAGATGHAVGRIAAFINPTTQEKEDVPVGGFGFFECPDDPAAARLLLDSARQWLQARGMQAMDGPINFGDRDRFWGLHVDGFDRLPSYAMFYQPPYYQALLENEGLQVYFRQYTYWMDVKTDLGARLHRMAVAFSDRPEIRFAHAEPGNLEKLARDLQRVYSLAWGRHDGVSPMTLEQARTLVQKMKAALDYRIIWFAYHHHEAVAMLVALPGLNQIFQRIGPNLNWWGKLKFLVEKARWERRADKITNAVLYGVIPEFQGTGIDAAMCIAARPVFEARGYSDGELVWIGDFNPKMMATCRAVGATICKTHHTYRQYFDPERPFTRSPIIGRARDRPAADPPA